MTAIMELGQSIVDSYNYYLYEKSDPRIADWMFMKTPWPIVSLVVFYYYFIKYAGPKFMEKRKPYNLQNTMIFYNTLQCIINAWAVFQGYKLITHPEYNIRCTPVTYSTSPMAMKITSLSYLYVMVKVIDLMDTIFMVLRKNYRQVTFLHVYHHIGMALGSWVVMKFLSGGHLVLVGFINCFVHTIMYFYYLLTAYDPEIKKSLWWKKHITELQMVQFFLILAHHTFTLLNPSCPYPKTALIIFISQNFVILYLFAQFYVNTYLKPKDKNA